MAPHRRPIPRLTGHGVLARPRFAGRLPLWFAGQSGQATVEVVALLPVLIALLAAAWQAVLAGQAVWAATAAARAAARAHAIGADPREAARAHLPGSLERGLRVTTESAGEVEIAVRIPPLPGLPSPGHARAGAHFEPQR
jgi:Flp pilus assembly protein TadG